MAPPQPIPPNATLYKATNPAYPSPGLSQRLSQAWNLGSPPSSAAEVGLTHEAYAPSVARDAGRAGEEELEAHLVKHLNKSKARAVFGNVRIPGELITEGTAPPRPKRRFEADAVIALPGICLVVEIKNYGGSIVSSPSFQNLTQTTTTGQTRKHGNPVLENHAKAKALRQYLKHEGIDTPEDYIVTCVAFVNTSTEYTGKVAEHQDSLHGDRYKAFLKAAEAGPEKAGLALRQLLRPSAATPSDSATKVDLQKVRLILASLPTWDEIFMVGGALVPGDIRGVRVGPAEVTDASGTRPNHPFPLERPEPGALAGSNPTPQTVGHPRGGRFIALMRALSSAPMVSIPGVKERVPLSDGFLIFRRVASMEDEALPLSAVLRITLSPACKFDVEARKAFLDREAKRQENAARHHERQQKQQGAKK
ncbi:hypothetical protein H696_03926 [Fonticula alba]|uniref:NERD domain-containing protein n=1 Tax=Fonticula alba TaxID=691883 RepID=A0A058Z5G3_FONAL|nr:hypothetical protein H696_03926 [Fonticula alba]KCV69504.1 hypothetical protein H696_03926 [Fonticula alba]|eukprot:XP_009496069.1 hypothetical protein H696_03926 [Fonticula alba]